MRWASFLLGVVLLAGCGFGPFPGGRLDGPEKSLQAYNWQALPEVSVVLLETRPATPYSVHVQLFHLNDGLYLDPAPARRWLHYIDQDARVRLRFSGDPAVYRALAVREENPEVLAEFDEDLVILRVESD